MIDVGRESGGLTTAAPPTGTLQVCIHRGTRQIGGTCIELVCEGKRILLDLGLPLDAGDADPVSLLPPVPGIQVPDADLLALVLSHGHADHWGLAPHVATPLPIVTGAATRRILAAAAAYVPGAVPLTLGGEGAPDLADRKTIRIGPFVITPFLMDHSAYDAYALLIEANGRRLFYSGDLRARWAARAATSEGAPRIAFRAQRGRTREDQDASHFEFDRGYADSAGTGGLQSTLAPPQ
jgi:ribonuclease J